MDRKRWPLWLGLGLIVLGGLLVLGVVLGGARSVIGKTAGDSASPGSSATPRARPTRVRFTDTPTVTPTPTNTPTPTPTPTPEPIVPTGTPTETTTATSTATLATATPTGTQTISATATAQPPSQNTTVLWQGRPRWGIGVAGGPISRYDVEPLRLGWYLDWKVWPDAPRPGGVEYVPMIRLKSDSLQPDAATIAATAQANPGMLWLVGNEPDVIWQDNVEPTRYATLYHEAYSAIKGADPTAQVAIGGITQPSPLRLRYLDTVLASYREQFGKEMVVDVWNVHNFVLREERGSWGVDIPPGIPDDTGLLREIWESDDLSIFRQQIVTFRQWMAERGYQNYPLIITEYGILMPEDYGFPPETVLAFMAGTFDYMLTATDPALGYPEDGYRLVQRWCWYSLDASDHYYPTGRLFDPEPASMTAVGRGWATYVGGN